MRASLSIKNRRDLNNLINRSVMLHFNESLKLLNDTSFCGESVVLHVSLRVKVSFLLQVIYNFYFFPALFASFDGIISYRPVEPICIVQDNFFVLLLIIYSISQEISLIQFCFVNNDSLRIICDNNF